MVEDGETRSTERLAEGFGYAQVEFRVVILSGRRDGRTTGAGRMAMSASAAGDGEDGPGWPCDVGVTVLRKLDAAVDCNSFGRPK
jgi:hypothetical protein